MSSVFTIVTCCISIYLIGFLSGFLYKKTTKEPIYIKEEEAKKVVKQKGFKQAEKKQIDKKNIFEKRYNIN